MEGKKSASKSGDKSVQAQQTVKPVEKESGIEEESKTTPSAAKQQADDEEKNAATENVIDRPTQEEVEQVSTPQNILKKADGG